MYILIIILAAVNISYHIAFGEEVNYWSGVTGWTLVIILAFTLIETTGEL